VDVASPFRHGARGWSRAVSQAVNTALARGARSYHSPELAREGFVVRSGFLTASEAGAAYADVARFADRAVRRTGVPGSTLRDRADHQTRDLNVRQLSDAERLSPTLRALAESGRLEATMRELTGLDLGIGRLTVQIDWPDTVSKRGLHVDSHWPPTYKAFVYLTPVLGPQNGPFAVVPGSHRHRLRKLRAIVGNYLHSRNRTDLDDSYSLAEARCLLGEPGTAIFADQRLAHAGWPGHTTGIRFMLVAYLYRRSPDQPR
jgi:ectoine hydroxylase-related dioxygenase (phytanoyl-CoA dioxygenase family)